MKNRKGFTLIELLAVIVILAVVVLIAVTAVIPRMNTAKKTALLDEARLYLKAAKESYAFDGTDISENVATCIEIDELNEKYVKKDNSNYRGTILNTFDGINANQTISLTNGKYYIYGNGNLSLSDVTDSKPSNFTENCSIYAASRFSTNSLAYKLLMNEGSSTLADNLTTIDNRTASVNFNAVEGTASKSGIYRAKDDAGTTYYYRGNVSNNWVSFGGFYWRIIRINGDGSVRMIYSGTASNHTGTGTQIGTSTFGDTTSFTTQTKDISGLTNDYITTTYSNGVYGNTYVGYMYNPAKVIASYPDITLGNDSSTNLSNFPNFTNIDNTKTYYFFKNFNPEIDCEKGNDFDESGVCTLKCRKLGTDGTSDIDCVNSNWNTWATTSGNYSTSGTGSTSSDYTYLSDYKYTCWSYGTAVTKVNSDSTTSVYISCPVVFEIVGTRNNKTTESRVKYHGLFSENVDSANANVKNNKIKTAVESWYQTNIYNKKDSSDENYLENYISDEIFCNDRTSDSAVFPFLNSDSYLYGTFNRISSKKEPSFKCHNKKDDGFSLKTYGTTSIVTPKNSGNMLLTYPVGLITADEVAFAGGKNGTNNTNYYLYTGQHYWTMSPARFYVNNAFATLWRVNTSGQVTASYPAGTYGVRPVINLKPGILYNNGNGTESSPYTVKLS